MKPITLFHIWSGPEMPQEYKDNILYNHQFVRPEDKHVLICDQALPGITQVSYSEMINEMRASHLANRLLHDARKYCAYRPEYNVAIAESDVMRFYYAHVNHGVVYADCDVRLSDTLESNDANASYFSKRGINWDIFLFADFGSNKLIETVLKERTGKPFINSPAVELIDEISKSKHTDKLVELNKNYYRHG